MTGPRKPGVTTWGALELFEGAVLLVINSPLAAAVGVAAVMDALEGRSRPGGVHVLAHPEWEAWLAGRRIPADRVLLSKAQVGGQPVEVNHFLEASEVMRWCVPKAFYAITGSTPHNQYNEEVQEVFEQRVSLLLGDGVFLAHCLPLPYVYVLDASALVHRFDRDQRVADYQRHARRLIDDLHQQWQAHGRPAVDDAGGYEATRSIVEQHLGRELVTFDEASRIVVPMGRGDGGHTGARVLQHLRDVLHARDVLLAERSEAVETRDRLLGEERDRYTRTIDARLRRAAGKAARVTGRSE